jgi:hypothetical protein
MDLSQMWGYNTRDYRTVRKSSLIRDRDITELRFGSLVAKSREYKKDRSWWWLCQCDCGRQGIFDIYDLVKGKRKNCGSCKYVSNTGKTIKELASLAGITPKLLRDRLSKGASLKEALTGPKSIHRKKAEKERRLVVLAIENISSTKTARERGLGASAKLIQEYTKLPEVAIISGLVWLQKKNIIFQVSPGSWLIKRAPNDNFCFKHGYVELFGGRCLKCLNEKGR